MIFATVAFLFVPALSGCPKPLPEVKYAKYVPSTQADDIRTADDRAPMRLAEYQQIALRENPAVRDIAPGDSVDMLSLADLVDVALTNSPQTRITWAEAMASAANWGRARSSYYPMLDGSVEGAGGEIPALQGGRSYISTGLALSYLLLDFGGRSAKAEAARQGLIAADWNHNQAICDLLRDVPNAYYNHIGSMAKVEATRKSLLEAETTLKATEDRRRSGVGTIVDVLQARANEAQVRVDLVSNVGDVEITRGRLATVVGWPANTPFEVEKDPGNLPLAEMGKGVDSLVEEARETRAAIAAAEAGVRQKEAELLEARALPYPKFTGGGNLSWQRMKNDDNMTYYGTLGVTIPIFHGFDMENSLRAARAELDAARAALKLEEENVVEEVWDAYNNFNTSSEQLKAANVLLASAGESFDASLTRYRAGAADIVELLNAQSLLASARAQVVDSRMQLYISYADLLHAVGSDLGNGPRHEGVIEERDVTYGKD